MPDVRDVVVYDPNDAPDHCTQCPKVPAKDRWGDDDPREMTFALSPQCKRCGSNMDHPHKLEDHDCVATLALRVARLEARLRSARLDI